MELAALHFVSQSPPLGLRCTGCGLSAYVDARSGGFWVYLVAGKHAFCRPCARG